MTPDRGPDITVLLKRIQANDPNAQGELLSQLYDELHRMAAGLLLKEPPGHMAQATTLLNEALERLLGSNALANAPDRRYLFAAVHRAMRQVLADHARRRNAAKRGGAYKRVPLDDVLDRVTISWKLSELELITIHEALERLEQRSTRQMSVVDLKVFGGLSTPEVARQLDISESTVEREFRSARAYLSQQLAG